MTAAELRKLFNDTYGRERWPNFYYVDRETYANVCQEVFENQFEQEELFWDGVLEGEQMQDFKVLSICVGNANKGIMFKNVELIIKRS